VDPTARENCMDDEHFCRHGLGELWSNNNIRHQGWETQLSKHIHDSMIQLTVSLWLLDQVHLQSCIVIMWWLTKKNMPLPFPK
jgi:hypothetical protein